MKRLGTDGFASVLAISLVVVSIIAIAAIIFGGWAYSGLNKYKKHADLLINAAVQDEKAKEDAALTKQFTIISQNPFVSYTGPAQYGSVYITYPKNWSGYVDSTGGAGNPVEGYFDPGIVPAMQSQTSNFALRLEVNNNDYSTQLSSFISQQQSNNLSITPYALKQVPSVVGVMIQGEIFPNRVGMLVMFPLRTTTLEIWTESTQYDSIFANQILPSVQFQP